MMNATQMGKPELILLAVMAAVVGAYTAHAESLTVAEGVTNVVTAAKTYDTVTVEGTLVISNAVKSGTVVKVYTNDNHSVATLNVGPKGTIRVGDYGQLNTILSTNNIRVTVANTNGEAGVVVGGKWIDNGSDVFGGKHHFVSGDLWASEEPTEGIIDLVRLNAGGSMRHNQHTEKIVNPNTKCDARINFNGGYLAIGNAYSAMYQFQSAYGTDSNCRIPNGKGGKAIILASENGNTIDLRYRWGPLSWAAIGSVKTLGTGDMRLWGETGSEHHFGWYLNRVFKWGHTGHLDLYKCFRISCQGHDVLPCVTNGGDVRLTGNSFYNRIELNGYTQHVNGVVCAAKSVLTNTSATAATLVFGSARPDGSLVAPNIGGDGVLNVCKVGSGTLTISNTANFAALDIQAGTVKICQMPANSLTLKKLTITAGATLAVDGTVVRVDEIRCPSLDQISCTNGGCVETEYDVTSGEKFVPITAQTLNAYGKLSKSGAGSLAIGSTNVMPLADLHVSAGTVRFADIGTTDKFWKIAITSASSSSSKLNLGPFRLHDRNCNLSDGGALGEASGSYAFTRVTYDESAVSSLAEKQVMFSCTEYQKSGSHGSDTAVSPQYAMFGVYTVVSCAFTNLVPTAENPLTIYYRIPSTTNPTYGYDVASQWDGWDRKFPGAWKIWSSPTGAADSWVERDSQSGQCAGGGQRWYHGNSGTNPNGRKPSKDPYPLQAATLPSKGFSTTANIQVDSGATLDCSLVTGGQEITSLVVDCATEGGTLKGVKFAESGTLALTNFSAAKLSDYVVPLTFDGASATDNLVGWTITVNGSTASGRHLAWRNGKLVIAKLGTVILMR